MAVPKFQSPTQLLTSWLRTNSRKRTYSDSDKKTDNTTQETKSEARFELKLNATSEKSLVITTLKENTLVASSQNNQIQELGTDDKKENYFKDQKSPALSPLRKRLCTNGILHCTTSNNQKHEHAKLNLNPGKETFNPREAKEEESDSKQTLKEPCSQSVKATSTCQASAQTKLKNWLTEWSEYYKAKHGDRSVQLPDKGGETTATSTEEEPLPPVVQPSVAQVLEG